VAVLVALALGSYDAQGGPNWIGPVGEAVAAALVRAFGLGALWLPVEVALAAAALFGVRLRAGWPTQAASVVTILLLGCPLFHLALSDTPVFGGHVAGGALGEVAAEVMRSLVGSAGAYVVCVSALLVTTVLRTSLSVVDLSRRLGAFAARAAVTSYGRSREGLRALVAAWREAKALEDREIARAEALSRPRITLVGEDAPDADEDEAPRDDCNRYDIDADEAASETEPRALGDSAEDVETDDDATSGVMTMPGGKGRDGDSAGTAADTPTGQDVAPRARSAHETSAGGRAGKPKAPVIVKPTVADPGARRAAQAASAKPTATGGVFVLPPTRLLSPASKEALQVDEPILRDNAKRLVEKLAAYGVRGRVDEIHPGPVVTLYEFEPESGTKLSKIAALADDLAMALAAEKVRIVAPIPGKARVGFELPNEHRQTVQLRELLETDGWVKYHATLPLALGKDIVGKPVFDDLSKMPHLLVAGATGSGKSVGLNVMLTSLLAKKTPEEVRLLMIDPKVVELAVFDGIPHMLLPVVTDMKKASLALRWAVDEMERRYQLFADATARNVASYNAKVERVLRDELSMESFMPKRAGKVRARGPDGEEMLLDPADGERPDADDWRPHKLPHIVVVVDEFADMMMVAAKDVEAAVARLAQKARAAGIHVILATQRPSVDVITGMIKANFPSRIAFKVSQREDSKTILGRTGAQQLLGNGDMLTLMPGGDLKRVHSAYISEEEVKAVCDFLRAQGDPEYDQSILAPRDDEEESFAGGAESDDPLYDRAVAVVAEAGYCSISHVQRKLGIGYNKAAEIVERMEAQGVVGPASGKAGGRREVLVRAA
jgi:S-DNA-T family DNA segregation ATPase FtsK/SpoIIIE